MTESERGQTMTQENKYAKGRNTQLMQIYLKRYCNILLKVTEELLMLRNQSVRKYNLVQKKALSAFFAYVHTLHMWTIYQLMPSKGTVHLTDHCFYTIQDVNFAVSKDTHLEDKLLTDIA